jgi:hypothetical protein
MRETKQRPRIVQVLPRFRPNMDGVTDYALQSAQLARDKFGIDTQFLICEPDGQTNDQFDGFAIAHLPEKTAVALFDVLSRIVSDLSVCDNLKRGQTTCSIVLQYSGYGYNQDGAPIWLLQALQKFVAKKPHQLSIATIFHELYATSPPWRRAFWYAGRQKRVARILAEISTHGLCTSEYNERIVKKWSPAINLATLPISSVIGEPLHLVPWRERPNRLVIFGLPGSRSRSYSNAALISKTCKRLDICEIWDIGETLPHYPTMEGINIVRIGVLGKETLGQALMQCRYGYLYHRPTNLAKSSVFGAYCSHYLVPIVPSNSRKQSDGLLAGRHFLVAGDNSQFDPQCLESISMDAWHWGSAHAAIKHAEWYASFARNNDC